MAEEVGAREGVESGEDPPWHEGGHVWDGRPSYVIVFSHHNLQSILKSKQKNKRLILASTLRSKSCSVLTHHAPSSQARLDLLFQQLQDCVLMTSVG